MGGDELEELRDFDDGARGDDTNAEGFGYCETKAWGGEQVDVDDKLLVTGGADDGDCGRADRVGEVKGDGLEVGADAVHGGGKGKKNTWSEFVKLVEAFVVTSQNLSRCCVAATSSSASRNILRYLG